MQKQVMKIDMDGFRLIVIRTDDKRNPYRVYRATKYTRKLLVKYADFYSVLCFVADLYRYGADVLPTPNLIDWAKARAI